MKYPGSADKTSKQPQNLGPTFEYSHEPLFGNLDNIPLAETVIVLR
jgi:hypothetical protein